jgi:hypothetical protein
MLSPDHEEVIDMRLSKDGDVIEVTVRRTFNRSRVGRLFDSIERLQDFIEAVDPDRPTDRLEQYKDAAKKLLEAPAIVSEPTHPRT